MANLWYGLPKNLEDFNKFIDKLKKDKRSAGVEIGVVENSVGIINQRKKIDTFTKKGKPTKKWIKSEKHGQPKSISVAEEAFYNCKGVPEKNIPPRDYQTKTIEDNMDNWIKRMKRELKKKTTMEVCEIMGRVARDATKRTINKWDNPKNAPITVNGGWMTRNGKSFYIWGKGKNTPLVDAGDLLKSITFGIIGGENK